MTEFWIKGTYGMVVHAANPQEAEQKAEEALSEICMDMTIEEVNS